MWGGILAAGLALRLWFLQHPMPFDDDTEVYTKLAQNLFHHGIYGFDNDGAITPTLIRLPGYPIFLGLIFSLFGEGNLRAVLLVQIALDLLGCWLIASFVRRQVSVRAGTVALVLASLCPFTAAYSAIAMTESLSIFAVSLGLWSTGRLLRAGATDRAGIPLLSLAMSMAMLLRPDGVLLTVACPATIAWYAWRQGQLRAGLRTALLCIALAALTLLPWAMRNWRTFHVIQPLAPRRVNDPGEYVTYGFYRWMSTWSVDVVSTGDVFWKMGTEAININDLPSRAFDSPAQRVQTAVLLDQYNAHYALPPELDARFDALARERQREHPLLCRVWVPVLRVADMTLRPRTETLGLTADWWRTDRHRAESMQAIALGVINLGLLLAAVAGAIRTCRARALAPWIALLALYGGLRIALLSTMENSEPRYSLEVFPLLLASAACALVCSDLATRKTGT